MSSLCLYLDCFCLFTIWLPSKIGVPMMPADFMPNKHGSHHDLDRLFIPDANIPSQFLELFGQAGQHHHAQHPLGNSFVCLSLYVLDVGFGLCVLVLWFDEFWGGVFVWASVLCDCACVCVSV